MSARCARSATSSMPARLLRRYVRRLSVSGGDAQRGGPLAGPEQPGAVQLHTHPEVLPRKFWTENGLDFCARSA